MAEIDDIRDALETISLDVATLEIDLANFDNPSEEEDDDDEEEEEEQLGRGRRERVINRIYEDNDSDEEKGPAEDEEETRALQREEIVDTLEEKRRALVDEQDHLDDLKKDLQEFKEKHGGRVTE